MGFPVVLRGLARRVARLAIGLVILTGGLILLYRVVSPPITPLMLLRAPSHGITKRWVPIDEVAPALVRAVIAAEDARFLEHGGVDWTALQRARDYNLRHGREPRRGGSTITMQCARNVFLWPGKSYLRKALEIAFAYAIDRVWGKRRVLEVYLNVIEWGPGVYGAEAAARRSFDVSAARLGDRQAALLAAVLPNPLRWSPSAPTAYILRRAALIERRAGLVRLDRLRGEAGAAVAPGSLGTGFGARAH